MALKQLSLILMSFLLVFAGTAHFRKPKLFLKIVPPYLPNPKLLVLLSGIAELSLGLLIWIPPLRIYAAWGIITLFVAVFPANVYMYQKGSPAFGLPKWALLWRLPLQGVLIAWAYSFAASDW